MDTRNTSVRPHARSRNGGKNHPYRRTRGTRADAHPGGVIHDNTRHTTRFTVIGNHLAQHPELSALAIGPAVHIQSLPAGTPVDIKTLAARFPEGPTRIAAALRELETHGYLRRTRERTAGGRIVTRTVSCNQPGRHHDPDPDRDPERGPDRAPSEAAPPRPPARRPAAAPQRQPARRPAALLAHRLTARLPPLPPFRTPEPPPDVPYPLVNCDGCDRAFRGPVGGRCHDCRSLPPEAA
ncbi:helix-turn-helix domain-containing protein [Streptomyces sp. NPDC007264]|uniref:helix-turn-helix domain-containing protein n=1 Tax=Streptomyces sp. NPDC007264 TaxID=3364777 RepID=UPI0036DCDC2D